MTRTLKGSENTEMSSFGMQTAADPAPRQHANFFEAFRAATSHEARMQVCLQVCNDTPSYLKELNCHVERNTADAVQVANTLFSTDNHCVVGGSKEGIPDKTCAKKCALLIYRSFLTQLWWSPSHDWGMASDLEGNILQATMVPELFRVACTLVSLLPCHDQLIKDIQAMPLRVRQEIMKGAARVIERRRNLDETKANARKLLSALYSGNTSKVPPLFWLHLCEWSDVNTILNRVCDAYKLCGAENPLSPGGLLYTARWRNMWQLHGEALSGVFVGLPDEIQIDGKHFPEDCPRVTDTLIKIVTAEERRREQCSLASADFSSLKGRAASLDTFLKVRPAIRRELRLHRPPVVDWLACIRSGTLVSPTQLVTNNNYDQLWKVVPRLCGAKRVVTDKEIMQACMQMHSDMCEAMLTLRRQVCVDAPPKWFDPGRFIMHCGRFDQACLTAMHALTVKHWGRHWFMDRYLTAIHTSFAAKRVMVPNKTAACPPIHWGNIAMFGTDEDTAVSTFYAFLDDLHGVVPDAKVRGMWQHVTDVLPFEGLKIWLADASLVLPPVEEKPTAASRSLWEWLFHN